MNYTGNPRHLRRYPRSSQKEYFRRPQLKTTGISERPRLDICQNFQEQTNRSESETPSVVSSPSGDNDTFEAKRRRLLREKDWLGLDIAAPIKIYDIRAAKERKRRANGPFMMPIFHDTSELNASAASQTLRSSTPTSRSSTSVRPQPTVLSLQSSQYGPEFIPSPNSSPASAQRGVSPSKSASSAASWNLFAAQESPCEISPSELDFVPEPCVEIDLFSRSKSADKDLSDMKTVWALVEEQKREDQLLQTEFGWGSQSGINASQISLRQLCQSRDGLPNQYCKQSQENLGRGIGLLLEEATCGQAGSCVDTLDNSWHDSSALGNLFTHGRAGSRIVLPGMSQRVHFHTLSRLHEDSNKIWDESARANVNTPSLGFESGEVEEVQIVGDQDGLPVVTAHHVIEHKETDDDEEGGSDGIPWF